MQYSMALSFIIGRSVGVTDAGTYGWRQVESVLRLGSLIEKAKEMLSASNLSITEIAYQLGFEHRSRSISCLSARPLIVAAVLAIF